MAVSPFQSRGALERSTIVSGVVVSAAGLGLLVAVRAASLGVGLRPLGIVLGAVGLLLLLIGLVSFVILPPLRGEARARNFGSHRVVLASTALAIVASNAVPLIFFRQRPSFGLESVDGFVVAALSIDLALLSLVYLRALRPGLVTLADLGLRTDHLPRMIGAGLLGGLAMFAINGVAQLVLSALGITQTQLEMFSWVRALPESQFLVVLVAGSVLAPISEEIFFRGFVFTSYARRYSPPLAALFSTVLFAVLHLNLQALLPIFMMGLLLSWLFYRNKSLIPGMIAHGMNNAVAFSAFYYLQLNT